MVAYSFQLRFACPIRAVHVGGTMTIGHRGTTTIQAPVYWHPITPKLHTIRANGKRRHAVRGEPLQLYCQQRSPGGFLIGVARCRLTRPIEIHFRRARRGARDWLFIHPSAAERVRGYNFRQKLDGSRLDEFANADGFFDWIALREFWREHHPGVDDFTGTIIYWEAMS